MSVGKGTSFKMKNSHRMISSRHIRGITEKTTRLRRRHGLTPEPSHMALRRGERRKMHGRKKGLWGGNLERNYDLSERLSTKRKKEASNRRKGAAKCTHHRLHQPMKHPGGLSPSRSIESCAASQIGPALDIQSSESIRRRKEDLTLGRQFQKKRTRQRKVRKRHLGKKRRTSKLRTHVACPPVLGGLNREERTHAWDSEAPNA